MALSKYRAFIARLESLQHWPGRLFIEIRVVAQSGFCFHPFQGDEPDALRCAFCKCMLANWKRDTDPWQEHAISNPFCVNLMACKGIDYIFKVIQMDDVNNGITTRDSFSRTFSTTMKKNMFAYGVKKIMNFRQQSPVTSEYNPVSTYTTPNGIPFSMPVHVEMTEFSARQDSLNKIPETIRRKLKLDEMAEAGLFFQVSGNIKCYYCGHIFENWQQHEDPWSLHVSQNYKCMHIVFKKGDDYIQMKLFETNGARRRLGADAKNVWKRKSGPDNEETQWENVERSFKAMKVSQDDDVEARRLSKHIGKAGKRRQRCDCCLQRRRETKIRQERVTRTLGNLLQRFVPQGNCPGPHICYKCHRGISSENNPVVSLCCDVIVCEGCVVVNECPKCQRSFVSSEKMTIE